MYFEKLWREFADLPEVGAVALGGSRAAGCSDSSSDYDLYIYCDRVPSDKARGDILKRYCRYTEQGNSFWELEDDCTLNDGVDIDILYRNLEAFGRELADVVEGHNPCNAYTTCMWHNLLNCKILYDRGGLAALKKRFDVPYPEELRANIIRRGMRLLHGSLPSYDVQLLKALRRGDTVAVNHRAAAFLETYFDVLFAVNRLTHPGEKRMVGYTLNNAELLPDDFESDIGALLGSMYSDYSQTELNLRNIINNLEKIIPEQYKRKG